MKYKLTLALVASLTSTAFAEFKAPLPEFKNEKQLAEWRAEKASESTSQGYATEESAFYTGKPYVASSGGYAFKYRSYKPELARWTSEDPSGFPDGTNNTSYLAIPTSEFDFQGLLVVATYSIQKKTLTIDGTEYKDCNSGNNDYDKRTNKNGPLPTGQYAIFSRRQGVASYNGHQAFILDPIDGNRYNDIWNESNNERNSFRIHTNVTTTGCIATASIDAIATQLWATGGKTQHDIIQSAPTPDPESFLQEWHMGTLTVVE